LLHRKPSVWALADFVQRKLDEKQTKSEIAEGLGKANQNLITELQALVDAPSCLHHAYATGIRSARTLYDLRRAYDEFPEQIEEWCIGGTKITRDTIQERLSELRVELEPSHATRPGSGNSDSPDTLRHDVKKSAMTDVSAQDRHAIVDVPSPQFISGETALGGQQGDETTTRSEGAEKPLVLEVTDETPSWLGGKSTRSVAKRHAPVSATSCPEPATRIWVEYKGKSASIAPDSTVVIVIDGHDAPLEVPVADLMFMPALM
jgi:ParB family chromosome partitioning protein